MARFGNYIVGHTAIESDQGFLVEIRLIEKNIVRRIAAAYGLTAQEAKRRAVLIAGLLLHSEDKSKQGRGRGTVS